MDDESEKAAEHELLPEVAEETRSRVDGLIVRARAQMNLDARECFAYADEAHNLSVSTHCKSGISKSVRCLAVCRIDAADYHGAIDLLNKAIALIDEVEEAVHESICYHS